MIGLGLHCVLRKGHPVVVAVVMSDGSPGVVGKVAYKHVTDPSDDFALQLVGVGTDLESRLPDLSTDAIVVRSMDHSARGRRRDVYRKRYAVEGVLLSVGRRVVDRTIALTGLQIGMRSGSSKSDIESEAASIVGDTHKEAGSAGLVALAWAKGELAMDD